MNEYMKEGFLDELEKIGMSRAAKIALGIGGAALTAGGLTAANMYENKKIRQKSGTRGLHFGVSLGSNLQKRVDQNKFQNIMEKIKKINKIENSAIKNKYLRLGYMMARQGQQAAGQ